MLTMRFDATSLTKIEIVDGRCEVTFGDGERSLTLCLPIEAAATVASRIISTAASAGAPLPDTPARRVNAWMVSGSDGLVVLTFNGHIKLALPREAAKALADRLHVADAQLADAGPGTQHH